MSLTSRLEGDSTSSLQEKGLCKFCGRNFSQYTCPSCNAGYCSLSCYRSEAHNQCTESFYRSAIEDEIRTKPDTSVDDRRSMLEMLKRLEDDAGEADSDGSDDDDENDTSQLAQKLNGLDLDRMDPAVLLSLLSETQRAKFAAVIEDPSGSGAEQLIHDHDIETSNFTPWWKSLSPDMNSLVPLSDSPLGTAPSDASKFVFNLLAICLAYAFTTRHLVSSPLANLRRPGSEDDAQAAREDIAQTAPFVTDRKSSILFTSADQVVTEIWSRTDAASSGGMITLLEDASALLQPSRVTTLSPSDATTPENDLLEANATSIRGSNLHTLLVDLRTLFLPHIEGQSEPNSAGQSGSESPAVALSGPPHSISAHTSTMDEGPKIGAKTAKPKGYNNHITMKLAFYAVQASVISAGTYERVRQAVRAKIAKLEVEVATAKGLSSSSPVHDRHDHLVSVPGESLRIQSTTGALLRNPSSKVTLIEEL
ncbi:hypothetical protein DL93DRAFT_2082441 [Clavulina sp. PMI_390]|nr:hypothetical protein DL93DRAFT_2082441 [Clavulina sp. PMI_390]